MGLNKNHEGYHDLTAGKALDRVIRHSKKRYPNKYHLTYKMGEIPQFRQAKIIIAKD